MLSAYKLQKKSILFFSRCELTYLYGSLHKYLNDFFNIIHVAYSQHERDILIQQFAIENVIVFKDIASAFVKDEPSTNDLEVMDQLLIEQTEGGFNLNSALQSNRSSGIIGYKNSVQGAFMYYKAWKKIFDLNKADFFVHEPVSLMMNQMAAVLCKQQGGIYTTHIAVQGDSDEYNFVMVDHYSGKAVELESIYSKLTLNNVGLNDSIVTNFLNKFRSNYSVFFSILGNGNSSFKLQTNLVKASLKHKLYNQIKPVKFDPVLDNIELFIHTDNLSGRRLKNIKEYKHIKYDLLDTTLTYYFYPLHLEPEAVVLYWADGLYTNQVKLIENIAAQLPPNVFLYVKDHPHLYGYRDKLDYDRIQNIPNVKLLASSISGKQIIKDCKGVITINGTGGFEALLMNKHVITFGSAYYSACKRVKYIKNIRELREQLYQLKDVVYSDDDELYRFLLAYLISQKKGFTDFYGGVHKVLKIDLNKNGEDVAQGLQSFFDRYSDFQKKQIHVE